MRRLTPSRLEPVVEVLSLATLMLASALLALYPQMLREYVAFPVNILRAGAASARVLVTEYLGLARLWPAVAAVVVAVVAIAMPVRIPGSRRTRRLLWAVVVGSGMATLPRSPHPLVHSLGEEAVNLVAPGARVVPSLQRPVRRMGEASVGAPASLVMNDPLTADHVFLIVLEGVTSADFEKDFLSVNGGFFGRVSSRATYFRRYYATNLDSYTSLIAMLTSVHVPYRAYADESLYGIVNRTANLTRTLRGRGFFTVFVSTYEHQPFVPNRNDWDRVLDRRDLPAAGGWASMGESRMEAATEDRAALSTIVDVAQAHDRTFVLQELVYGHSTEWRAKTGLTQLAYYDAYLLSLLDRLETSGLSSRSLMVVVSDHGDRATASVAENYRVPLVVVGSHPAPGVDAEFRSHLDLGPILASRLGGTALPPPRTETYVVGSTGRWVYGVIQADSSHLFIDDTSGKVLSGHGGLDPSRVREAFQASVDEFDARFGR